MTEIKKNNAKNENDFGTQIGLAIIIVILSAPKSGYQIGKKFQIYFDNYKIKYLLLTLGPLFLCLISSLTLYFMTKFIHWEALLLLLWLEVFFLSAGLTPFFLKTEKNRITVDSLKTNLRPKKPEEISFDDKNRCPVGVDIVGKKVIYLDSSKRTHHMIVMGATGVGKTTLLYSMLRHDIKHKRGAVFIDPKGARTDLEYIKKMMVEEGRSPSDLIIFSVTNKEIGGFYNPLKFGESDEKVSKLMEALTFSEQYYRSRSAEFLTGTIQALDVLEIEVTIDRLVRLVGNDSYRNEIADLLALKVIKRKEISQILSIFNAIKYIKKEDLSGLAAQLAVLNSLKLHPILSENSENRPELFIPKCISENKIVYIQLNALVATSVGSPIGKLILQDLIIYANQKLNELEAQELFPVYVDEFGSFAMKEMAKAVRITRQSGLGFHLFYQSSADTTEISKEFDRHIFSNPAYKIAFRTDEAIDVERFVTSVGTIDGIEKSQQVNRDALGNEFQTGGGNERMTKQMVIEHDILKRLSKGQCVIVDKIGHEEILLQCFNGKISPKISESEQVVPKNLPPRNLNRKFNYERKPQVRREL